jgi:hypothetical protein
MSNLDLLHMKSRKAGCKLEKVMRKESEHDEE